MASGPESTVGSLVPGHAGSTEWHPRLAALPESDVSASTESSGWNRRTVGSLHQWQGFHTVPNFCTDPQPKLGGRGVVTHSSPERSGRLSGATQHLEAELGPSPLPWQRPHPVPRPRGVLQSRLLPHGECGRCHPSRHCSLLTLGPGQERQRASNGASRALATSLDKLSINQKQSIFSGPAGHPAERSDIYGFAAEQPFPLRRCRCGPRRRLAFPGQWGPGGRGWASPSLGSPSPKEAEAASLTGVCRQCSRIRCRARRRRWAVQEGPTESEPPKKPERNNG